jgi:hypothetical protein
VVTLNMWIAAPFGGWLSTDFRVSDVRGSRVTPRIDHWSPKYVTVTTTNEFTLALTYAGLAEVTAVQPDFGVPVSPGSPASGARRRVPLSDWLLWTLFGEGRTLDQVVHHIADEASKLPEFRRARIHHSFMGIGFGPNGEGWWVAITNWDVRAEQGDTLVEWRSRPPLDKFFIAGQRVDDPPAYLSGGWGSGRLAMPAQRRELLSRRRNIMPRKPEDYMDLLAKANAEAAAQEPTVSPACQVMYLPANPGPNEARIRMKFYKNGQDVPPGFNPGGRGNLFGIPLHVMEAGAFRTFTEARQASEGDESSC